MDVTPESSQTTFDSRDGLVERTVLKTLLETLLVIKEGNRVLSSGCGGAAALWTSSLRPETVAATGLTGTCRSRQTQKKNDINFAAS